ncbi:MAG: RnfABCDGE type electron transport complex subunit G [Bacteroidetes bacterium]|nr:RnfABCDGE type electron transport complex subunit G [Bacteroidota bacterium]
MKSSLKNMVVVLATITTVTSFAVGYVYKITKEPIRKSKVQKTKSALEEVLPSFETLSEPQKLMVYDTDAENIIIYKATDANDAYVGCAVESYSNNGYGGTIRLVVGFDVNNSINKIAVVGHSETPGLGAKITETESPFIVQFQGKNPNEFKLSVKPDGGDVDAITASTISSRAYTDAVKRAFEGVKKSLGEEVDAVGSATSQYTKAEATQDADNNQKTDDNE